MRERLTPEFQNTAEAALVRGMREFRPPFFISSGRVNLAELVTDGTAVFEKDLDNGQDQSSLLYVVTGRPGSGKSTLVRRSLLPYAENVALRLRERYKKPVRAQNLPWDRVKDFLVDEGVIRPLDPGLPFTKEQLQEITRYYRYSLAYALSEEDSVQDQRTNKDVRKKLVDTLGIWNKTDAPLSITVTDKLDAGVRSGDPVWLTSSRYYAPTALRDLQTHKDVFKVIPSHTHLKVIGMASGPTMEYHTLRRAQEGGEGATQKQLETARGATQAAIEYMKTSRRWGDTGKLPALPVFVRKIIEREPMIETPVSTEEAAFEEVFTQDVKKAAEKTGVPEFTIYQNACYRVADAFLLENNIGEGVDYVILYINPPILD